MNFIVYRVEKKNVPFDARRGFLNSNLDLYDFSFQTNYR